jgi:hypothetical protein
LDILAAELERDRWVRSWNTPRRKLSGFEILNSLTAVELQRLLARVHRWHWRKSDYIREDEGKDRPWPGRIWRDTDGAFDSFHNLTFFAEDQPAAA